MGPSHLSIIQFFFEGYCLLGRGDLSQQSTVFLEETAAFDFSVEGDFVCLFSDIRRRRKTLKEIR